MVSTREVKVRAISLFGRRVDLRQGRPAETVDRSKITPGRIEERPLGGPIISGGKPFLEAVLMIFFISLMLFHDPLIHQFGWLISWIRHFLGMPPW